MEIQKHTDSIFKGVQSIIENAREKAAAFLNAETTLLYWQIGNYINQQLIRENRAEYGAKIIATPSQQLSWRHLIEPTAIENEMKRDFFIQLYVYERWSIRELRQKAL